ncbi:hypothetical protein [Roseibium sp.]|jgi:ABC-type glycerol-3-phosphate transport system substrate-binding protein|uniref:hypothetical protein n=1 Tax=Roseibium sp. TaxID=1936156 RepID=UPI00092C21F8|nr:hypothetical protein BKI51_09060 [Alphaproteobacteria bacterium AO1-B]
MQRNTKAGAFALGLILAFAGSAAASPLPQETITLPEDSLEVTVASASLDQKDPLESELTIWVGEVNLNGRDVVWVELIDSYGEVIYDSEVSTNETHLLPDGRAVVVNALDPQTMVAEKDESRLVTEGALVVTRRVINDGGNAAAVELIETSDEPVRKGTMLEIADFGQTVWERVVAFFNAATSQVKVAWTWLVDTLQA